MLLTRLGLALDRAITFYQIATKIESVYVLSLPPEVSALLQVLHMAFAIDLDSFGLPLGCLSLASFYNKLICMMLLPVILCLLIVLGCVIGTGLIARFLQWLARMLRELSRLGSKRMPPVDDDEVETRSKGMPHVDVEVEVEAPPPPLSKSAAHRSSSGEIVAASVRKLSRQMSSRSFAKLNGYDPEQTYAAGVSDEEEEEASRPSAMPATRCIRAAPYVLEALYLIHAAPI